MNAIDRHHLPPSDRDRLMRAAEQLVSSALDIQGAAALTCTRRQAAFHEAGHCVAHHAAGDRIRSVKVYPHGTAWLGFTKAGKRWAVQPETDPGEDLRHAVIYLAGPMSEICFSGAPALAAGVDEVVLAQGIVSTAALKLGIDRADLMEQTIAATFRLLTTQRPALDALAARLMHTRKLEGQTVTAILRTAPVAGPSASRPNAGSKRADFA